MYIPRGERDVIRLRNPTEDKRAFRQMLTNAGHPRETGGKRLTFLLGPRDPKRFGRAEKWDLGTRQDQFQTLRNNSQLQGGKTFCASLIAGSRRAFLFFVCWLCSTGVGLFLFVTERVLTETEWNAQGVAVCFSKNLFTFVWFLFFVNWKLLWSQNNQC